MLFEIHNELRENLNDNESLLWAGKPKSGFFFRQIDIFLIPFSILWSGFIIFWLYSAYTSGAPLVFLLFGIPFALIGVYLLFGRFFYDAKQRKNIIYGLTEKRIIIKSTLFSKKIQIINLQTLSNIQYIEKSDGSGSITMQVNNLNNHLKLDSINDVRRIYNKIREQQRVQ